MESSSAQDTIMAENTPADNQPSAGKEEPKYGGFTRFEIELEVRIAGLDMETCY
jgi:hypothetical protein